jgi:hypothetical protein
MSGSMLYSAAGGAFMTKTINEAKTILGNILQNLVNVTRRGCHPLVGKSTPLRK